MRLAQRLNLPSTPSAAWLRAAVGPALCGAAYANGLAHGPAPLLAALLLAVTLYAAVTQRKAVALPCFVAAGVVMLALGMSLVPGYSRVDLGVVSVNAGKAVAGLSAVAMLPSAWRWNRACTAAALACLVLVPALAWAIGFVHWAPATPAHVATYAFGNLFGTIAEEWFFRRWLHTPLQRYGRWAALVITAVLFGIAHVGGGPSFMLLAGVAGLFYGAVFQFTGSVWASVLLHLALNVLRAALFGG
ncbi:type II CAAX prenyl endopeptidase Rce1 family protein [Caldimonas brevitalea]|uniref:CAAX prenyl protease 2/Lysostaphin resistance protein A-like domain-containing protein n=1 Tax=Caldimonas brevitalea TaxID=413882 RepID=A0A0G3BF66_9BURK|nr:CPBP family intramembrane glutamic endopeptidase [Caldimonas brevitalea]AKJ28079.1 hypothetical protein AAW51_1388 [Caldimonas brevitalea]